MERHRRSERNKKEAEKRKKYSHNHPVAYALAYFPAIFIWIAVLIAYFSDGFRNLIMGNPVVLSIVAFVLLLWHVLCQPIRKMK